MKHRSPDRRAEPPPGAMARRPCSSKRAWAAIPLWRASSCDGLRRGPWTDSRTTRRSHRPIFASSDAPTAPSPRRAFPVFIP